MSERTCRRCGVMFKKWDHNYARAGQNRTHCRPCYNAKCLERYYANPNRHRGQVVTCGECGSEFKRDKQRKGFCSKECAYKFKRRRENQRQRLSRRKPGTCAFCAARFTYSQTRTQRFCSRSCAQLSKRTPPSSPLSWQECSQCSRWFVARRRSRQCSDPCKREAQRTAALAYYYRAKAEQGNGRTPTRYRRAADKRSKRLARAWVEDVTIDYLIKRDKSTCHICKRKVSSRHVWPDNRTPSIDHLVPLSQGGDHSKANTALAHLGCNLSKHTRAVGEQLRLVG